MKLSSLIKEAAIKMVVNPILPVLDAESDHLAIKRSYGQILNLQDAFLTLEVVSSICEENVSTISYTLNFRTGDAQQLSTTLLAERIFTSSESSFYNVTQEITSDSELASAVRHLFESLKLVDSPKYLSPLELSQYTHHEMIRETVDTINKLDLFLHRNAATVEFSLKTKDNASATLNLKEELEEYKLIVKPVSYNLYSLSIQHDDYVIKNIPITGIIRPDETSPLRLFSFIGNPSLIDQSLCDKACRIHSLLNKLETLVKPTLTNTDTNEEE